MKLKEFIKKLQEIRGKYRENAEVIMADYIPVVGPVFLSDKSLGDKIVIIDE